MDRLTLRDWAPAVPDVVLFTRDLRVTDNPALMSAGNDAVPLYVADPRAGSPSSSPNQAAYLHQSLADLNRSLHNLGSSLVYRKGEAVAEVQKVVAQVGAKRVHVAQGVSGRDQARAATLSAELDVPVITHVSTTVADLTTLKPQSAPYYQRFTPYYRRWMIADRREVLPAPRRLVGHKVQSFAVPSPDLTAASPFLQEAGESRAREAFGRWLATSRTYGAARDRLDIAGTSRISAALRFGEISPLEVVEAAEEHGATAFARQLAWRDFNYQLLFNRPELETESLRPVSSPRSLDSGLVEPWKRGRTGYPVIDAAMRQLCATGWMHNRARMLTASFLTKHLQQDWRVGADWFRTLLTDADIANNQLNWQWAAGVGVDPKPWRMFNPTLQSRRFDPDGTYIRKWVPELAQATVEEIHDPSEGSRDLFGYPIPIVGHREAVARYKRSSIAP